MDQLVLTRNDILTDIEGFEERIQVAMNKLAVLPASSSSYPERKRLNQKRRALRSEISHVERLVSYAMDALKEMDD